MTSVRKSFKNWFSIIETLSIWSPMYPRSYTIWSSVSSTLYNFLNYYLHLKYENVTKKFRKNISLSCLLAIRIKISYFVPSPFWCCISFVFFSVFSIVFKQKILFLSCEGVNVWKIIFSVHTDARLLVQTLFTQQNQNKKKKRKKNIKCIKKIKSSYSEK